MNWRIPAGLILLILGIRAFYITFAGQGHVPLYTKGAIVLWVLAGVYFLMKGITVNNRK